MRQGSAIRGVIRDNATEWTRAFARWIADLNARNAGAAWWAYTSTAKNLLSSSLGSRFMEALATVEMARRADGALYICGATPGQMETIRALLRRDRLRVAGPALRLRWLVKAARWLEALLRVPQQAVSAWIGFLGSGRYRPDGPVDLWLFTYVDSPRAAGVDAYFGRLREMLKDRHPGLRTRYAAYVYAPYRQRILALKELEQGELVPLFGELTLRDYIASAVDAIRALFPGRHRLSADAASGADFEPLLREALIEDVRVGGYLHNVLVYRAARNFARRCSVRELLYPYENKSLEKLLLLGARAGAPGVMAVGYQHTSLTPRHITLLFEPTEAAVTPLPDRIVTVGEVTRRFLETSGHYPDGLLVTGCALRQRWGAPLPRQVCEPPRLLLALSSSRSELIEAVQFVLAARQQGGNFELAIRTHPNFPTCLLPVELRSWVQEHARDLSGTPLRENLDWCDAVAYASSTVALEALMVGRPVVNVRLSDAIDPDPLLEPVPLAWKAASPGELLARLSALQALDESEFGSRRDAAIEAMKAYFRPYAPQVLDTFLMTGTRPTRG